MENQSESVTIKSGKTIPGYFPERKKTYDLRSSSKKPCVQKEPPALIPPPKLTRTRPAKRTCARNLFAELEKAADPPEESENVCGSPAKKSRTTLGSPTKPTPKPIICSPVKSSKSDPISEFKPRGISDVAQAKRLLTVSTSDSIVARDSEYEEIKKCLEHHIVKRKSTCLYVSGPPGTGKTVTLTKIINDLSKVHKLQCLMYNSMDFNPRKAIYSRLADDLVTAKVDKRSQTKLVKAIEKNIMASQDMVVFVLDEIDGLLTKDADLLYTIFDWPAMKDSKLILIGVANTYDFTDRSLSKLAAFGGKIVRQYSFRPYRASQIANILKSRLKHIKNELFMEKAIELCAKSVASHHCGDIRKAFDFCRRALEMAELESRAEPVILSPLKLTSDDGLNPGSPKRSPTKTVAKPVLVNPIHISRVIGQVSTDKISIESLSMPQISILSVLLVHSFKKKLKEIDMATCHNFFSNVTNKGLFSNSVPFQDFLTICQVLETKGLVKIKQAKEMLKSKISLAVNETDLRARLQDQAYINSLMKKMTSML